MQYRRLGKSDLEVSVIGVGCNRIADPSRDRREVVATLEAALEQGINYFDTADRYGFGASERLLGEVLRGRRDRVVICSKAGKRYDRLERIRDYLRPFAQRLRRSSAQANGVVEAFSKARPVQRFDSGYVSQAVERSLRRLRTDYLDLFLFHNPSPEVVCRGDPFEMGRNLISRGLIRHYGVACGSEILEHEEALGLLLEAPQLTVLQMRVNLSTHETIKRVLPLAARKGLGVVAFEPLGKGSLLKDGRLEKVLAQRAERTAAQLALRFVLDQPAVSVVLVGMTKRLHLTDNLVALRAPSLTEADLSMIVEPNLSPVDKMNRPGFAGGSRL